MKICAYCGRENIDEAVNCCECGTDEFKTSAPVETSTPAQASSPNLEFTPLNPADMQNDLVVLMTCRTLLEADMIVGRLDAAGITAFIPDQFLMQTISWNLNTFGFVRVQVSPSDYEAAKTFLLLAPDQDAGDSDTLPTS